MFASGKAASASAANYIEDVFSTYLYTGNGSTQTITNGIDLSTKGGLVWLKQRTAFSGGFDSHCLVDTLRGAGVRLQSDLIDPQYSNGPISAFTSSGFSLNIAQSVSLNENGNTIASWTFREQPKFFDVVTYTGNGTSNRDITHNLGSTPGCIIIKRTDTSDGWLVRHRSMNATNPWTYFMELQTTNAASTLNDAAPTNTTFRVSSSSGNANGGTYVAYLFAHDAGGFGLTGTDNVISCGSFTTNGSGIGQTVNLGYEPQWVLWKNTTSAGDWQLYDTMRGLTVNIGQSAALKPNLTNAEAVNSNMCLVGNGFRVEDGASATYIYIAIRRGPMKVPTSGTSVFQPVAYTGTNVDNRLVNTGIVTDMTMARIRTATSTGGFYTADRLRGNSSLGTAITDAENTDADSFMTPTVGYGISFSAMNGFGVGNDVTRQLNQSSTSQLAYAFQRASGFFDEVCYTGTGVARTINHNLGVVPEMMIVKPRSTGGNWSIYHSALGNTKRLYLDSTAASVTSATTWNSTTPTSTVFSLGTDANVNDTFTYVWYGFATCAGVSKIGSYTGTGTTKQVDCGFTGGARFVLIKRTDSTGDWYVWDTARGIVSGNDSYLLLNSTAAEVTNTDYVDTYSAGFEISSTAPAAINASGGTFIFLAIA